MSILGYSRNMADSQEEDVCKYKYSFTILQMDCNVHTNPPFFLSRRRRFFKNLNIETTGNLRAKCEDFEHLIKKRLKYTGGHYGES